jgi:cytochrome c-type biogenesis protein CcmH
MFWIISLVILLVAGLALLWPMLQAESRWKVPGLMVLVVIPALGLWQYSWVGSPRAMQMESMPVVAENSDASLDELVESLRNRLTESPADVEGWVLLGRTYKATQDYPAAVEALETADRLVPNEPVIQVELVEARLFASGNPQFTAEMVQTLENAVAKQDGLQKGWMLLGLAAAQQGDDATAVAHWRRLLQLIEPGTPVAQTIEAQITEAESRLQSAASGNDTGNPTEPPATWQSAPVLIDLGPEAAKSLAGLPAGASLFLIAREAGQNSGPPLAVRRIEGPVFPLELRLSDRDSMLPQRPVSGFDALQLQARVSVSGEPMASAGDWQSAVAMFNSQQPDPVMLVIDKQVE